MLHASAHRPRFLVVLGNYGNMGGAERQAFHLIEWLRERDFPVSTLGWTGEGPLAERARALGCEVHHFPYRFSFSPLGKALDLIGLTLYLRRKIRPEVILPFVSIHSKPLCRIWKWTGARYCWWNQQDEGRCLFGSPGEKRALLNAVDITSNSTIGADFLSETYGIPRDRIHVYNNGTPLPDPSSLHPRWRTDLEIGPERPLVSMIANITSYKDHATLLRAWVDVVAAFSGLSEPIPMLVLAGHLGETEHVQYLKAQAFDLGLGDFVRFIGAVESTDELIWESDLVVHSSVKEGCPNAVCEAMALAKAVVGTDIPGMRQALGEIESERLLAAPGDAAGLAGKIVAVLKDRDERLRIGAGNRRRIEQEFSIDKMTHFFLHLIERGLSS